MNNGATETSADNNGSKCVRYVLQALVTCLTGAARGVSTMVTGYRTHDHACPNITLQAISTMPYWGQGMIVMDLVVADYLGTPHTGYCCSRHCLLVGCTTTIRK